VFADSAPISLFYHSGPALEYGFVAPLLEFRQPDWVGLPALEVRIASSGYLR